MGVKRHPWLTRGMHASDVAMRGMQAPMPVGWVYQPPQDPRRQPQPLGIGQQQQASCAAHAHCGDEYQAANRLSSGSMQQAQDQAHADGSSPPNSVFGTAGHMLLQPMHPSADAGSVQQRLSDLRVALEHSHTTSTSWQQQVRRHVTMCGACWVDRCILF